LKKASKENENDILEELSKRLIEAWKVLSNKEAREEYDRYLKSNIL